VQRGLLLDVVVGQGAAILQLLAGKDQALLVRGDACKKQRQRTLIRSAQDQPDTHSLQLLSQML
jgi:hypothetical protein